MKMKKRELVTIALVIGLIVVTAIAYMIYTNKIIGNKNIADNASNSKNPQALAEGETWTAETLKATVDTSTWDLDKVNIVESADGIPVPVPKGFFASELEGENTVLGGFVIYSGEEPIKGVLDEEGNRTDVLGTYSADPDSYWQQSCNRNQWVWVPVPDASRIYETDSVTERKKARLWTYSASGRTPYIDSNTNYYEPDVPYLNFSINESILARNNLQGLSKMRLKEETEIEFALMIESIERYKGFYIGRYETSDVSIKENIKPGIYRMKGNNRINNVSWFSAIKNIPYIEKNDSIRVSMIFGCLWDETLQWLVDSGNKSYSQIGTDSRSWGTYYGKSFKYTTESGSTATRSSGMIPSGSTERNNSNNIYDLAGNLCEWTLESRHQSYCLRGSNYSTYLGSPAYMAENRSTDVNTAGRPHNGVRACFYIK